MQNGGVRNSENSINQEVEDSEKQFLEAELSKALKDLDSLKCDLKKLTDTLNAKESALEKLAYERDIANTSLENNLATINDLKVSTFT